MIYTCKIYQAKTNKLQAEIHKSIITAKYFNIPLSEKDRPSWQYKEISRIWTNTIKSYQIWNVHRTDYISEADVIQTIYLKCNAINWECIKRITLVLQRK